MNLLEYYKTIGLDEIEIFISEGQEETSSIEFKTVNHPEYQNSNRDYDKKNLSKCLSGFANSQGGIIIWGVKAQQNSAGHDVASEKKPIKELTKFLNILNRLEGQSVTPIITGILHERVLLSNDCGFVKTYVPPSEIAPHMANFADKHYYKRSGDSFYQCEHYDIIDMLSRKKSPKLELAFRILEKQMIHQVRYRYNILVSIKNIGHNIAKYPFLGLNFSAMWNPDQFGLDGNGNTGLSRVKSNMLYQHNYGGGINNVVYAGSTMDVNIFCFEYPKESPPPNLTLEYLISAQDTETVFGTINIPSIDFKHSE